MNGSKGPAVGTAFHPEADSAFTMGTRSSVRPAQLARLPRRRRPGMIALAVALVGVGILASTALYSATNHHVSVLVATVTVPAGSVITASDLGTASIAAGPGVRTIPTAQARQVIGQVAGTALYPGMLLTASELATSRPPAPGQVLVPLPMRPSVLPASGLSPGDQVLIVATPGAQGQAGSSSTPPVLTAPVAGVVEAVSPGVDTDGFKVVDVLVPTANGAAVVQQASTGQLALIMTRRAP
ncbi:MAG TPA: SAF domain-containing protein [Streptosporangiaceae bacterium]|nr:SAF domain-containing protein [Streptosporangiaceae bacterium]